LLCLPEVFYSAHPRHPAPTSKSVDTASLDCAPKSADGVAADGDRGIKDISSRWLSAVKAEDGDFRSVGVNVKPKRKYYPTLTAKRKTEWEPGLVHIQTVG